MTDVSHMYDILRPLLVNKTYTEQLGHKGSRSHTMAMTSPAEAGPFTRWSFFAEALATESCVELLGDAVPVKSLATKWSNFDVAKPTCGKAWDKYIYIDHIHIFS